MRDMQDNRHTHTPEKKQIPITWRITDSSGLDQFYILMMREKGDPMTYINKLVSMKDNERGLPYPPEKMKSE